VNSLVHVCSLLSYDFETISMSITISMTLNIRSWWW